MLDLSFKHVVLVAERLDIRVGSFGLLRLGLEHFEVLLDVVAQVLAILFVLSLQIFSLFLYTLYGCVLLLQLVFKSL